MIKVKLLVVAVLLGVFGLTGLTHARTIKVKGYTRKSTGTYVMPSYRTSPNRTKVDNYSTKGNYNPYSGKKGYVSPLKTYKFR